MRVRDAVRIGLAVMAMFAAAVFAAAQQRTPPPFDAFHCVLTYQGAVEAVDSVYGIVPGVKPADQLRDSIALSDAADQIARYPSRAAALCSVERVTAMERLTTSLRAYRATVAPDDVAARLAQVGDRAARAVQDAGTWLPIH